MAKLTLTIASQSVSIDLADAKASRLVELYAGADAGTEAATAMTRRERMAITVKGLAQTWREAAKMQRVRELERVRDATLATEAADFADNAVVS